MRMVFFSVALGAIAVLLVVMHFGCGTSDPLVNPAQTLPVTSVDSTLLPPPRQYDWTDYRLGHWEYYRGIGWTWVPGYIWSPSQVVWFTGYEYLYTSPLPPPDVVLPRAGELETPVQGSRTVRNRNFSGGFDEANLHAILDKIRTHRVAATATEILRANLALDFPLTLFSFDDNPPPPGPPPAPRFFLVGP